MATVSIPLHSRKYPGLFTIVDEEDYERISQYRWHPRMERHTCYAMTNVTIDGKYTSLRMHRVVMGAPDDQEVDHWDRNGLNNTRANLRYATTSQNNANQGRRSDNHTGFTGVYWHKGSRAWRVEVGSIHIGMFECAEDAARAYDIKAIERFGEFAVTNFPDSSAHANRIQAMMDSPLPRSNTSGFLGVTWNKQRQKWAATITHQNRQIHCGFFSDPRDAARVRDTKARELHGPHAKVNFPT